MRLEQLKYVIAVSDYGSMNTAAQYLHVSQQNISKSIKQLENELDIEIFSRSKRGARLTTQGAKLYQFACEQMSEYMELQSRLDVIQRNSMQGTLNLCTMNSGTSMIVPQLLCEFYRTYPNVVLNIQDGTADFVLDALQQGSGDLGIITYGTVNGKIYPKISEQLKVVPLIKGNWYFWVSKNSVYAKKGCITFEEANKESILVDNAVDAKLMEQIFKSFGLTLNIGARVQSVHLLGAMIAEGKGVFSDISFSESDLMYTYAFRAHKNLAAVPVKVEQCYSAIGYVMNPRKAAEPLLKHTVSYLENHFLENGGVD